METARRVLKEFPRVRIVFLTIHANEEYVLQTRKIGVAGYLLKPTAP